MPLCFFVCDSYVCVCMISKNIVCRTFTDNSTDYFIRYWKCHKLSLVRVIRQWMTTRRRSRRRRLTSFVVYFLKKLYEIDLITSLCFKFQVSKSIFRHFSSMRPWSCWPYKWMITSIGETWYSLCKGGSRMLLIELEVVPNKNL